MKFIIPAILAMAAVSPSVATAQTDLGPLNLPSIAAPLPLSENFEAGAGTVPPYMALTNLEVATLLPDVEAWCNVGQLAPCINPFGGAYALEMGLAPGLTSYHDVRNAMVLQLDGSGYTGNMDLSFLGFNAGEETDTVDGVWVSSDGIGWYQVFGPWNAIPTNTWTHSGLTVLDGTPVDTSGVFYLAFCQEDNFPYNDLDGIGIDEISIPGIPAPPVLTFDPLTAGLFTTVTVESEFPGRLCKFLASTTGGGPTIIGSLTLDLTQPIIQLADVATDANGTALFSTIVHPALAGAQVWLQAVVFDAGGVYISNSGTQVIL
ncbi:MAG: hypothetical protein HQ519_03870 [Planctomycetes bacterium]|nr:hypothetical protein [Planctomycetota bacterium]